MTTKNNSSELSSEDELRSEIQKFVDEGLITPNQAELAVKRHLGKTTMIYVELEDTGDTDTWGIIEVIVDAIHEAGVQNARVSEYPDPI